MTQRKQKLLSLKFHQSTIILTRSHQCFTCLFYDILVLGHHYAIYTSIIFTEHR